MQLDAGQPGDTGPDESQPRAQSEAMEAALRLLEQTLAGPQVTRYRAASSSRPGEAYELEMDAGGAVLPGFGYRGSAATRLTRRLRSSGAWDCRPLRANCRLKPGAAAWKLGVGRPPADLTVTPGSYIPIGGGGCP
jgi:hypothetical protein